MTITLQIVEGLAPDQASLKAASKQMKAAQWPLRGRDETTGLIWGECQGSGANPYRVMADTTDHGYKCTCPSRKFPCKHALALMWMFADSPAEFAPGAVPDWVNDWVGRRRKSSGSPPADAPAAGPRKSLAEAQKDEPAKPVDPKVAARRKAQAERRSAETIEAIAGGLADLEQWIADQLRHGLSGFIERMDERCRRIAARLVDAKAQALASRLDELPSRLLELPANERPDAAMVELGKLVLLSRAWRANPGSPDVHGSVASPQGREAVFSDPQTLKVTSRWEVLAERIATRRDGLIAQSTWLLNLKSSGAAVPGFALLLDFFPQGTGRRSSAFSVGAQFDAELAFYRSQSPLRALIAERQANADPDTSETAWPSPPVGEPLAAYWRSLDAQPWAINVPILLPSGRLRAAGSALWWTSDDGSSALPVGHTVPSVARGVNFEATAALWDGRRCHLLCGKSDRWGRIALDG